MVHKTGVRNTLLTGVGFAAWLAYILACAPSFSPDDTKVLFPSIDSKTGATTLAMYDRGAKTTRTLLVPRDSEQTSHVGESHDGMSLASAWSPDGQQAIALWAESKDDLRVAVIPIAGREPIRLLDVPDVEDASAVIMRGPAIAAGRLFVPTKDGFVRVDLATGARTSKDVGDLLIQAQGDAVYYTRGVPEGAQKAQNGPAKWEFGRVDPETLALKPTFQSEEKVTGDAFFAVNRDGSRLAVAQGGEDSWSILVFDGPRVVRRIAVGTKQSKIGTYNLVWSPDGRLLYSTYRKEVENGPNEFGVAELPADGAAPRYTPLLFADINKDDGGVFEVALSHDGRTLAAASTYLGFSSGKSRMKPEDLALYLVDLSRPDRRVTKISIAAPQTSPKPAGK